MSYPCGGPDCPICKMQEESDRASREKYPKLYEPVPEEWIGAEFSIPERKP